MGYRLRYAARSDVGMRRAGNEDSGLAASNLLVVADGMGGHAAGELASAMAVATFAELVGEPMPDDEVLEHLAAGVELLTERIGDVIAEDPSNQGMGTTVTGLSWKGNRVAIVHVGDSRAYRLRDGHLSQLTKDHTYVQTLVDVGDISPAEATTHPRRNLLVRAVDGIHPVEGDLSMRETRPGDRYLLCTDGLTGMVSDETLAAVLRTDADPTGAVTRLVDMALEGGAPDNVTVVVADIADADDDEQPNLEPVVVGAAGEPANRARLPGLPWPVDEQLDPDYPSPRSGSVNPPVLTEDAPSPASRPRTKPWTRVALAAITGVVVLLAIVGAGLLWWVRGQWYVSTADGLVAVYHGVPGSLGPIPLQRLEEVSALQVSELPSYDQSRVLGGILTHSFDETTSVLDELNQRAAECRTDPATPGCPGSDR
ncbi:MAG: PP2C family serine/threonine-protein phosphatase [Candidatus Nanopelagicales bacterium]|nr:protein phosphatase 2C domain-containing protein [Candidatus Nanopelagicales bacterium]MDZ4248765.1 PP2C family serine/threonine-protein phosphatase [Candidatus Nanopelagicales bacterium]